MKSLLQESNTYLPALLVLLHYISSSSLIIFYKQTFTYDGQLDRSLVIPYHINNDWLIPLFNQKLSNTVFLQLELFQLPLQLDLTWASLDSALIMLISPWWFSFEIHTFLDSCLPFSFFSQTQKLFLDRHEWLSLDWKEDQSLECDSVCNSTCSLRKIKKKRNFNLQLSDYSFKTSFFTILNKIKSKIKSSSKSLASQTINLQ